jgi:cell division protein FtsI/penicillin-binding protein 2
MRFRTSSLTLLMIVSGAGLAACGPSTPTPNAAASAFVAGWRSHNFGSSLKFVDASGAAVPTATVTSQLAAYTGDLASITPTITAGKPVVTKNDATVALNVSYPVTAKNVWSYQTSVPLRLSGKTWQVVWGPKVVEPDLIAGGTMKIVYTEAERGKILDAAGAPIVEARDVVDVGVEPKLIKNIDDLIAKLQFAFKAMQVDVDLSDLKQRVSEASPTAFVDVVTLRSDTYAIGRPLIHDLDGTVFNEHTLQLAPTRIFAHAVLGEVDEVTKETMDKNPGKYRVGDHVGYGGLQQAYDAQLRGTDGVSVVMPGVGQDPDGSPNPSKTLFKVAPVPGQPIKTTLDPKAQKAADAAVQKQSKQSAFIAMKISTGEIIAVANGPGATGQDLAMEAQVPPGSIFKMVTATNVLESGAEKTSSLVDCPPTLTVDGRTFHNSESEALGKVPLITDFAKSCNTAFASLYPKLGANGLANTAKQLGIGGDWSVGVPTYTGSVPDDGSNVDQAAAAFGQGKTLVSPVAMCAAAAAVARGQWKAPSLVADPAPASSAPDGTPLKAGTVTDLKAMMRAVITSGTAKNRMAGTPGGPVYAKTGTAEYDGNPAHTHAWFIGYQGDIAFAVLVVSGGFGATAAAPIAKNFLTAMS